MFGHCDVVKCLLSSGAVINFRNNFGLSVLFEASYHGHCYVVKCLLCSGANINLSDKYGQSPLFVASQQGRLALLKVYLVMVQISICVMKVHNHRCL
jgi:ankyrin repeat protein